MLNKNQKIIFSNIFSLFILQGTNYILPIVLLPYLVRVLGVEYFGLLAFSTATIGFFRGIVSYGFELSGTQQISVYRDNKNKIIEIFSSILIVKSILAFLSLLILLIIITFIEKFNMHWEIFLFTFFIIFGDVLFPIWFFQGIEKMQVITYLRVGYKLLFTLLVIIFVQKKEDFLLVPLFDSMGAILAGIIAIAIIAKKHNVSFTQPSFKSIIFQFKNSWHIFISNIAVYFYSSINIFVLGILTNNTLTGYYAIAEKIYMAIRSLFGPIIQALFPFLAKKYKENKINYYHIVKKISIIYFITLLLLGILVFYLSDILVELLAGQIIIESVNVLKILSFSIVFAIGSFFTSFLIIKGEGKILSKITFISMFINIIFVYPSIYLFGIYGLATQFVMIQIFQAVLQLKYNKEIFIKER
jgi:PST family polysaccharide transporter